MPPPDITDGDLASFVSLWQWMHEHHMLFVMQAGHMSVDLSPNDQQYAANFKAVTKQAMFNLKSAAASHKVAHAQAVLAFSNAITDFRPQQKQTLVKSFETVNFTSAGMREVLRKWNAGVPIAPKEDLALLAEALGPLRAGKHTVNSND